MTIVPKFRKAERMQCKASVLLEGLSGNGKSGLSLALAYGLVKDWERIAAVDTENRSLPLYVGATLHTGVVVEPFMVGDLTADDGYKPSHYEAYRHAAIQAGYQALICDSISHMWQYKGGVLDIVNDAQARDGRLNKWTAWGTPEVVAEKLLIQSLIRHPKLHCINTVRVKEKIEASYDDSGKTVMKSMGEQQIIMPDLKYEPDLVLTMLEPGTKSGRAPKVKVIKSRYAPFEVHETYDMTAEMIEQLRLFLEEGTSPEELLNMQHQDYIRAVTQYLDENPTARQIWPVIKDTAGYKDTKLEELPLPVLKNLFSQLAN